MPTGSGRELEFVMGFISQSDRYRSQYTDRWEEIVSNFIVRPPATDLTLQTSPYRRDYNNVGLYKRHPKRVILKDGETHKVVMTYVSILMTN